MQSETTPAFPHISSSLPPFPSWALPLDDASASGSGEFGEGPEPSSSRIKRSRVALACQRCKGRKQKCDGAQPCTSCRTHSHRCEYVVPQKPMPFGKNQYIKALERRVAELETLLAGQGLAETSRDHWSAASSRSFAAGSPESEPEPVGAAEAILDWQDGEDSVVSVLRSLSLDVNGGYMGASSHVALGRLFNFLGHEDGSDRGCPKTRRYSVMTAPPTSFSNGVMSSSSSAGSVPLTAVDLATVPDHIAERLFQGHLKHISTRWPVVHSVRVRKVHHNRKSLSDVFERTILHLVYATSGRFIETTGESGPFDFKGHYASAVQMLDVILGFNDVRTVQVLMLMAVYCLRDPVGAGAWMYSRAALLIAIDHGLHRQTKALSRQTMESELRKRLFWACYAFDRQISIPMGRPFGISDHDIDVELPLDIAEETALDQSLADAPRGTLFASTSLTSFVHVVRLRQIESDIQQTIYRVDDSINIEDSVVDSFLARLEEWKAMIPADAHGFTDKDQKPFNGLDVYLIYYHKCQRLLLYPQITKTNVAPRFLKECAEACAGVCGAYKRLHQSLAVGYSLMALQTVFMAGLTLIYCVWISPEEMFNITTSNGIHDCSIVLFVIAERVPTAKKYRNAFDAIRQRVIDHISRAPERKSRDAVSGFDAATSLFDSNSMPFLAENGSFDEFSRILTDMAGGEFDGAFGDFVPDEVDTVPVTES